MARQAEPYMSAVAMGMALSVRWAALAPHPDPLNSQSPLEMIMSLRGVRLGSCGLMMSSTVTAAMALMLVDAVLGGTRQGVLCGQVTPRGWPHRLTCQDPAKSKGRGVGDKTPPRVEEMSTPTPHSTDLRPPHGSRDTQNQGYE